MQEEFQTLVDKTHITEVINRYFRTLDEKQFDLLQFEIIFAPTAQIVRPNNTMMEGPEAIYSGHKMSFAKFESTQHILTGHTITVSGDTAVVRVNLIAIHLWNGSNGDMNKSDNYFIAGGVVNASLTRLTDGWKILRLQNNVIWRKGGGHDQMQNIGHEVA